MDHLINEISQKLKAKNILNHVTVGAALTNNMNFSNIENTPINESE